MTASMPLRRNTRLALRRIILVCWIALSVAVAPIMGAWAAMHGGKATGGHELIASHGLAAVEDTAATADMADCHKAMQNSGDCPCCDTKAKCSADAACTMKCCKVLGTCTGTTRLARHPMVHDRPAEPAKPSDWLRKPPSPPPRA